jgi:hypothetical protein
MVININFTSCKNTRKFSSSTIFKVEDKDLDLSDKKNKQKATEPEQEQDYLSSHITTREERHKQLIETFGEDSEALVEQILYEEFDIYQQGSDISGDSYDQEFEEKEIENRRNRYFNYTYEQKAALENAKQEYYDTVSTPGAESIISNKLKDISIESSIALSDLEKNPLDTEALRKADLLGDLFEIYKYGPEKFDSDRRLNEFESISNENKNTKKDKNSDDPDGSDSGIGGVSSSNYNAGEGPSGTSGNFSSSGQRDLLNFQSISLLIFSSFGAFIDYILEILVNIY